MLRRALDELDGEIDAVRTAAALLLVVHLAVSLALGAVFGRTHLSAPLARLRAAMEQAGSGAGGSGLGLTVVRTLTEAMGGRLEIDRRTVYRWLDETPEET